jgi:hypothetical protein
LRGSSGGKAAGVSVRLTLRVVTRLIVGLGQRGRALRRAAVANKELHLRQPVQMLVSLADVLKVAKDVIFITRWLT